ncbi:cytosine methyltransferase [Priestia megaterium]|uniref:DNA-methyltransferase n=1 Tax=Priestia megaterium TaxID=1404 RepID=UPI000BFC2A57|nr:site-specific DNA-methyltransferase [Priestia megaterium]PGN53910.1 cytosine methyltransferase [Priestia megaterium]
MAKKLIGELELNRIYQRDCIEGMRMLPDKSIDMILCDLPYGTTACKWDTVIPFETLWAQYERIIKDNGAIVLTASQPFTSALVMSNPKLFRYTWVWDKVNKYTGALNANRMPLKRHEDICVFYKNLPTYNKQYRQGKPYKGFATNGHGSHTQYGKSPEKRRKQSDGNHNPCSILEIKSDNKKEMGLHPTQKPIELFAYLIRTYTDEGEIVLDNCMGSGTTAIAALRLKRNFVGFERESEYIEIANKRLDNEVAE